MSCVRFRQLCSLSPYQLVSTILTVLSVAFARSYARKMAYGRTVHDVIEERHFMETKLLVRIDRGIYCD